MTLKSKGPICNISKKVSNAKSVTDKISKKITGYYTEIIDGANDTRNSLNKKKDRKIRKLKRKFNRAKRKYIRAPWRSKRPDVTLLVEIMLGMIFLTILYKAMPLITGQGKPAFTPEQLQQALKLPKSAFDVTELAKVNMEVKSLSDYSKFFKSNPYSPENSGMLDLMRANALLPIIVFMIQFVIPPFVVAYIIWFIIRFWKYVIAAVWGWFTMLYSYFTKLIQCKLGCKWYIRMVTDWSCCSPNFADYVVRWKRKYIDRPIYYEKLKYVRQYYEARRKYYEIPYRKYIEIPYKRYKIKAQFAKKMYIDRAVEVFLKKLRNSHPRYVTRPKDELYRQLLKNNKNLASVYAKAKQAKAQIEGKPYKSVTATGKVCVCPANKTPAKMVKEAIKNETGNVKKDLDSMIDATNKIYDKITNVDLSNIAVNNIDPTDCQTYDTLLVSRRNVAKWAMITMIVSAAVLFAWTQAFGAPGFLKAALRPSNVFVTEGLKLVQIGTTGLNWFWMYTIMTFMFLLAIYLF